jgi:phosphopantetheinyl transferase (holo-ACP synthase)
MRLFLSDAEQRLAISAPEGVEAASTRLWTVKECAAKALGIPLPAAWRTVEILEGGQEATMLRIERRRIEASHSLVNGHIVTLLVLPSPQEWSAMPLSR